MKVTREHGTVLGQTDGHVSPHTRSLITANKVCQHYKGNLKGSLKAETEVTLQILTESSSQAGTNKSTKKFVQEL